MGRVPPPKEPSGCIQTLFITRIILQILAIPLLMILGTIIAILGALFAFAEHPVLGFVVVITAATLVYTVARWEYNRVSKEMLPPEDE